MKIGLLYFVAITACAAIVLAGFAVVHAEAFRTQPCAIYAASSIIAGRNSASQPARSSGTSCRP